jgi:aminobutyraldehyde dehydrogenase
VLVHQSVADRFAEQLVTEVSSMVVGAPGAGDEVEIGPMITKDHFDRVKGYLERAEKEGVRPAIGGGALAGKGYFIAPTVLVDVPDGAEVARGGDLRPGHHDRDLRRGGRGGEPCQLRALRPVRLGLDQ